MRRRDVARSGVVRDIVAFFRQYPQVLVLLIICLVLGIGTFLVVILGLLAAHNSTTTGEPSGVIGNWVAVRGGWPLG